MSVASDMCDRDEILQVHAKRQPRVTFWEGMRLRDCDGAAELALGPDQWIELRWPDRRSHHERDDVLRLIRDGLITIEPMVGMRIVERGLAGDHGSIACVGNNVFVVWVGSRDVVCLYTHAKFDKLVRTGDWAILPPEQTAPSIHRTVGPVDTWDSDYDGDAGEEILSAGTLRLMRSPGGSFYFDPEIRSPLGAPAMTMLIQLTTERDNAIRRAESAECDAHDRHLDSHRLEDELRRTRGELIDAKDARDTAEREYRAAEERAAAADCERFAAVDRADKAEAECRGLMRERDELRVALDHEKRLREITERDLKTEAERAEALSAAWQKTSTRVEQLNAERISLGDKLKCAEASELLYENTLDALCELASGDEDTARQTVRVAHEMARSAGIEQRCASRYWSQISDTIRSLHTYREHLWRAETSEKICASVLDAIQRLASGRDSGASSIIESTEKYARDSDVSWDNASDYWRCISSKIISMRDTIVEHEAAAKSNEVSLNAALEQVDRLHAALLANVADVERAQLWVINGVRALSDDVLLGECLRRGVADIKGAR